MKIESLKELMIGTEGLLELLPEPKILEPSNAFYQQHFEAKQSVDFKRVTNVVYSFPSERG